MRIGVKDPVGSGHPGHVSLPEEEIAPPQRRILWQGLAQNLLLLIAVARTGDAAGEAGGLHQTRTVDAVTGIPGPEVGRAEKYLGHRHRIGHRLVHRPQVARAHEPSGGLRPTLLDAIDAKRRRERQARARRLLDVGRRIEVGLANGDDIGLVLSGAQRVGPDIAHIPVACGGAEDPALVLFEGVEAVAVDQFPVASSVRLGMDEGGKPADRPRVGRDEVRRLRPAPQIDMSHAAIRLQGPPVTHSSTSSSASSIARAPCPTPPKGRAGAGLGCQP